MVATLIMLFLLLCVSISLLRVAQNIEQEIHNYERSDRGDE